MFGVSGRLLLEVGCFSDALPRAGTDVATGRICFSRPDREAGEEEDEEENEIGGAD